ncbi:HDIG domain-containing protein [Candidatus Gottesmanbacteria bacterium]|nr:HDIG domain-containing protein [Candidatus Gottesmanbacteria bacterium]
MIPNEEEVKALWDKYQLPDKKRLHVSLVAKVALFLAKELRFTIYDLRINDKLLLAGALLHDIDKNIPKLPGEVHPDAAVRILRQEEMREVADLVKTHPLHAILDPKLAPKTWEEKLLFLADKMVKHEIVGVDTRFSLWNAEHLPQKEQKILDRAYPKVKALEREIFDMMGIKPEKVAQFA